MIMQTEPLPDTGPPPATNSEPPSRPNNRRLPWKIVGGVSALLLLLFLWHSLGRADLTGATNNNDHKSVATVPVRRQDLLETVQFYAEFRPYQEVELHAKVTGYVDRMLVDFGDRVKKDQLLASLEIPELKDDLSSADATQQEMEAAYEASHLEYQRLTNTDQLRPGLIAQQQIDDARARDLKDEQAVVEAKAKVGRLKTMLAYTQITAPFPGVITHRYVDTGALIQAGTGSPSQSPPLVRISQNDMLRLDFPVSISFVSRVQEGTPVEIQVDGWKKPISAAVTRISDRVDESTRTMTAEVEVPNPDLKLVPGMYANVNVAIDHRKQVLTVPPEAVERGQSPRVLVAAGDVVEERPVQLGLETPDAIEITEGLQDHDQVIIGGHGLVHAGDKITSKPMESASLK